MSPDGARLLGERLEWRYWSLRSTPSTGERCAEAPVGQSPAGVAVDGVLRRVYVANRESNTVSVLDLDSLQLIASVPVGSAPFALAVAPDGGRIFVANVRSADISIIDARTLTTTQIASGGKSPYGVVALYDGRVAVVNQQSGKASVIDANSFKTLAIVKIGLYPEGAAVAPGGRTIWIANWFSGDVSVIDLDGYHESKRIAVGHGPRSVVFSR